MLCRYTHTHTHTHTYTHTHTHTLPLLIAVWTRTTVSAYEVQLSWKFKKQKPHTCVYARARSMGQFACENFINSIYLPRVYVCVCLYSHIHIHTRVRILSRRRKAQGFSLREKETRGAFLRGAGEAAFPFRRLYCQSQGLSGSARAVYSHPISLSIHFWSGLNMKLLICCTIRRGVEWQTKNYCSRFLELQDV